MNNPQPRRSWIPGAKTLAVVAVLLLLSAVYVTVWWPFQKRVALIRDLETVGASVSVDKRGPEWLRNLTGYHHPYELPVNPGDWDHGPSAEGEF